MEECLKALIDFTLAKPCCTFKDTLNHHKPDAAKSSCPAFSLPRLLVLTFLLLSLPKQLFSNLGQFS